MQKRKGKCKRTTIEVIVAYQRIWGDCGVEYCSQEIRLPLDKCINKNLIVVGMNEVIKREQGFLDYYKDEDGWIQWIDATWKDVWGRPKTVDLHILNTPDVIAPIIGAKRNARMRLLPTT